MLDPDILGPALAEIIRDEVAKATAPLRDEIAGLKAQLVEAPGAIDVAQLTAELQGYAREAATAGCEAAIKALPAPKDGQDAEPVTEEQIAEAVRQWCEANPPADGKDGVDGKDGRDGIDGKDGEPGRDGKDGADGLDGRDGVDGRNGEKGDPGDPGRDGADGIGMAGAVIDRDGELTLTNTAGAQIRLGRVVGKDGEKGDAGRDGFSLTDFDTSLDADGRLLTLSLESGDLRITHELELGGMIYRGVWKEGQQYAKGDTVTWAGSLFHCDTPTSAKPESGDWTLAAKRGRDGKDAK